MKIFHITIFLMFALSATIAFSSDDDKEPKLGYSIIINEKKYDVDIDKEYEIKGKFDNPRISLKVKPYRHFSYGGIEFNYPAYFTWSIKEEQGVFKQWILSGRNMQIHYLRMQGEYPIDAYIDALANQYGKDNCEITKIEYEIKGQKYQGKKLNVRLAGVQIIQDILKIQANGTSRFLIFLNKSYKDKSSLEESKIAKNLIDNSFKIKSNN